MSMSDFESNPQRLLWLDPASPPVPRLMRSMLGRYGIIVETPPSEDAALDWLEVQNFDLLAVDKSIGCREYRKYFLAQARNIQADLPFAFTEISDPEDNDHSPAIRTELSFANQFFCPKLFPHCGSYSTPIEFPSIRILPISPGFVRGAMTSPECGCWRSITGSLISRIFPGV